MYPCFKYNLPLTELKPCHSLCPCVQVLRTVTMNDKEFGLKVKHLNSMRKGSQKNLESDNTRANPKKLDHPTDGDITTDHEAGNYDLKATSFDSKQNTRRGLSHDDDCIRNIEGICSPFDSSKIGIVLKGTSMIANSVIDCEML